MKPGRAPLAVGRVAGPYGIKGWVRITSYTDPPANLFDYAPWTLRDAAGQRQVQQLGLLEHKVHGKGWVAKLEGIQDRDAAETLKGLEIVVDRSRLPEPGEDHYYWADLEGLEVRDGADELLGSVDHLLETGSADVMVIVGEAGQRKLVPFVSGTTVTEVDLEAGVIRVDWSEE